MISITKRIVQISLPPHGGEGLLGLPDGPARGVVLFAHGRGDSRHSPRDNHVAGELRKVGFGTLLFDLPFREEADDRETMFNIALLADRLDQAATWVREMAAGQPLPLGFFGVGTGAAAALTAAATGRTDVRAIVSHGGRPDLASTAWPNVAAATLLIVGGNDRAGLSLNRMAYQKLTCTRRLEIVPDAADFPEKPGAFDLVCGWFARHLAGAPVDKSHTFQELA